MAPEIIAMGEPLLELNQIKGENHYLAGHGGDTSNCVIAAARQGASVGYVTALGQDAFGDSFMELWRGEGVDCTHVGRHPSAHTGMYIVNHGAGGHSFTYFRAGSAASRMTPADVPEEYIAGAKIFHVSGISQAISSDACDAVFHAIEVARRRGLRVSYDTNLRLRLWPLARARATIHAAIARCDIALPSLEDARALTGLDDPEAIVDVYLGMGPGVVCLKCGADGALLATATERRHLRPHPVTVVDATGAGDTFDGAFLASLVRGADPFAAAEYANVAAALSTTGYGAVAPIPLRQHVEEALALRERLLLGM